VLRLRWWANGLEWRRDEEETVGNRREQGSLCLEVDVAGEGGGKRVKLGLGIENARLASQFSPRLVRK
jgi:hypothetical protein